MKLLRFLLPLLLAVACARAADKPNIVLIVADDMGYADAGFMGGKECSTPALDALAKDGAVLAAHYVQPVCSPTRSVLMTGRLPSRTGVYSVVRPGAPWGLPLGEQTMAQMLKAAGYETAICGKWHLGEFEKAYQPTQRGFDHQYGHFFGAIDYFDHTRDGKLDWYRNDQPLKEEGYSTSLIAKEACRIIREKQKDQPLFLYVPFNAVHGPHQVPESYEKPFTKLKGVRRTYAGMLAAMDEAVAKIVAALDEAKLLENTLIIFTSDNGGPSPGSVTDNGPLRASKGTIYEGGVRACAFATWPGRIPAGQKISEPVQVCDWLPTLAKIVGGKTRDASELDGRDILPVLTEQAKSPHEALLIVGSSAEKAAIRVGDWKLHVKSGARGDAELYNLASDIGEKSDVAEQHPAKVKELRAKLNELTKNAVPPGDSRK